VVSFNEMHGFYYELHAISSGTVCYYITADQTLSLLVGGSDPVAFFYYNDRIKGKQ
jgi:hypothetical protein